MRNRAIILFGALLLTPLFSHALTFTHPLSQGMQGDDVQALQQYLKDHGYLVGWQATGLYGPATVSAVPQFQKDNGLEAVGSVGPKTRALLNGGTGEPSAPLINGRQSLSQADLIASLLAQVKVLQSRLAELIAAKNGQTPATPSTPSTSSQPPQNATAGTARQAVLTRLLSQGSSGSDVTALQQFLNTGGYLTVAPTGYFGPATAAAVAAYQKAHNLEAVGSVGPKTRALINAALNTPATTTQSESTSSDQISPIAPPVQAPDTPTTVVNYTPVNGGGGGGGGGGGTTTVSPPPDTTAPTITVVAPLSTLSSGTTQATLSVTTNEAATCVYSTSQSASFASATAFASTRNTTHSASLTGLQDSTSYTYYIQCQDAVGNTGTASAAFSVSAPPVPPVDTTPPTAPQNLQAIANYATQVTLTWGASTDNVGVINYQIFLNGGSTAIAQTVNLTYADTGLVGSTQYAYTVKAVDAAGNLSPASNQATVTTLAPPDTTPPSITITAPLSNISSGTTQTMLSATTNESAACRYSTDGSAAFSAMTAFTTTGNTSHSTTLSELQDSTSYAYYVKCQDVAGNTSGNASVSFSVASLSIGAINVGSRVVTTANLNVRASASPAASVVGSESTGSLGTVVAGPTTASGHTWWQVNYDNGLSGWSIGDYLVAASAASSPAIGMSAPSPHASAIRASEASRS